MHKLTMLLAAAATAAPLFTGAVQAAEPLTDKEQAAIKLSLDFNVCIKGTPEYWEQRKAYDEAHAAAELAYENELADYRAKIDVYAAEAERIGKRDGLWDQMIALRDAVADISISSSAMDAYFIQVRAIEDIIAEKVLAETGIQKPEDLAYPSERVTVQNPGNLARVCANTLQQGVFDNGLNVGWGISDFLESAAKKLGPQAYLDAVTPKAP